MAGVESAKPRGCFWYSARARLGARILWTLSRVGKLIEKISGKRYSEYQPLRCSQGPGGPFRCGVSALASAWFALGRTRRIELFSFLIDDRLRDLGQRSVSPLLFLKRRIQ